METLSLDEDPSILTVYNTTELSEELDKANNEVIITNLSCPY